MNETIFLYPLIVMGLSGGFLAFALRMYPEIFNKKQHYPYENEIEDAIKPYAILAIMAAYRQSEHYMDEFGKRLRGKEKAELAINVYHLIASLDHLEGIPTNLITQDMVQVIINKVFGEFDGFYIYHQERFKNLFEQWKNENLK